MAFEFVSSGRCPSDILLPFQGEEVGGVTFTQGGALGYVLLPLRGEAGINGGIDYQHLSYLEISEA